MLNFKEFQDYVKMNIPDFLPEEHQNVEVTLNQVTKNNGTEFHAIVVRAQDSNIIMVS